MLLHTLTIHAAHDQLARKHISSVELTQAALDRIAAVDGRVHAYLQVAADQALAQAQQADVRRARGDLAGTPLLGIPLAIKDVICVEGMRCTCGGRILENFVPFYNATVVERLRAQGAVILGKTNTDEFAMGSSTENSAFGPTRNPWNLERVPGGSSGGSAAAVASEMALGALGTDTGGSVRQPASLCGVVGLKPTYGLISRYGLIAFASSLDTVGTFTRSVRDAATLLSVLGGKDPMDATSLDEEPHDFTTALTGDVSGLRVGVVREAFGDGVQPGVKASVQAAIDRLADMGASVGEVSLPHTDYALSAYYLIAPSEASSNLARYDGVRYGLRVDGGDSVEMMSRTRGAGFGPEVKRRIMLGTYALSRARPPRRRAPPRTPRGRVAPPAPSGARFPRSAGSRRRWSASGADPPHRRWQAAATVPDRLGSRARRERC